MIPGTTDQPAPVFTVGYGDRTFDSLAGLLEANGIGCLVDIRTAPYSKFKPEFSQRPLQAALTARGIRYLFLGDMLGGRPDAPDCYVDGKVDYDRVREKEFYRHGIEKVCQAREQGMRLALMCSEGRPEDCHRSKLVGQSLAELGIPIAHLDEAGVPRTQDEVIARLTGGQLDLFGGPSFTSRKRYRGRAVSPVPEFFTIGVYGFTQEGFFGALREAGIDTFCDIRRRRGVRGSEYAFVNAARLQQELERLGIRYRHFLELAPSPELRAEQAAEDKASKTAKRQRGALGEAFVRRYRESCLAGFESAPFAAGLGPETRRAVLFCVEREPQACHRSLVAEQLEQDLRVRVTHLFP